MSFIAAVIRNLRPTYRTTIIQPRTCIIRQQRLAQVVTFPQFQRGMASKTDADTIIEDITELYATARDEFEIAMEETEKSSVYAEEDRKAAKDELGKVQAAYKKIVNGDDKALAEEISKRIGHRIRELENGVQRMEEMAMEHD